MGLGNYAIKRLLLLVPVLLGITAVVFLLVQLTPGSPITVLLPPNARTPSQIAALRDRLGLDQPLYVQYVKWVTNAAQGDLGRSYATRQPVTEMIADHLGPTLELASVALFVALFVAIPVGILSAVYKDTAIDHLGRIGAFLGISMPSFWVGIMAILVFALFWQEWFGFQMIPAGGYASPTAGIVPWLRHIIAPGLVLGLGFAALTTRLTRAAMLEVLNEDYIRTARSKGVKESTIVLIHGFRNAFIPVLTVLGLQLGFLINGSVVIEQVFQWPGIGQLLYTAVEQRDMPLIQGIVLLIAVVFVFANLAVDLLYAFLDPRIKYD